MTNEFKIDIIRKLVEKYYQSYFLSMFDEAIQLDNEKFKIKGLLKQDYIL